MRRNSSVWGSLAVISLAFFLGAYFTYAAIQGDYGLFRRAEIEAQSADLRQRLAQIEADVARMEILTRRLSDDFLDLDLLDEQARDVLGLLRADEIVIR
ncbi:MAG: septum formation initiator family protein [Roseovarius sp.]|nr:septum formation initiator family protein [Roseovarius sp.]